jgi:hypothetical protein
VTEYSREDGHWPGLAQVFRLERRRVLGANFSIEIAYGITSLGPDRADAARLLKLTRDHGGIENSLFWVRDVCLGEDACRVRSGGSIQILGALRNVVIHLARAAKTPIAGATRRWNIYPHEALQLLTRSIQTSNGLGGAGTALCREFARL